MLRVDHSGTVSSKCQNSAISVGVNQIADEVVRVLRQDALRTEHGLREVLQVGRNDDVRFAMQRRRKHVPVARIGQHQIWDSALKITHHCVWQVSFHQCSRAGDPLGIQVGPVAPQSRRPLAMYVLGPSRPEGVKGGEEHEYTANGRRIKDAGVEKCDWRHRSPSS